MSDVGVIIDLDDQSIERSKIVLDYTSRDFTAIRAQLIGLAKGLMPDWQTAGESPDFGTLILELFAYMGDVLHYYIDRTASEAFLGTAIRRQSVLYIADMMGYVPIGQQSASVELTFTIDPDDPEHPGLVVPVTIPKNTRVFNETNNADEMVIFELVTDVDLDPKVPGPNEVDKRSVIAYGNEGVTIRDKPSGSGLGSPNSELIISDKGVITGSVGVTTREGTQVVTWSFISHLSSARPTQAVFTTYMDEFGFTHIVFGDNSSGRIPPVNAEFFLTYRYGVGAAANALPANSLTSIANVPSVDLSNVSVTNKASPVGGTDPESIDSMRFSISRGGSKLRQRAVTLNDYAELAMQVPGVAKSVAWGAVYTAVHVRVAPIDGKADANYMERLLNSVDSFLIDKIMVGSQVYPEPADVEDLWQDIYIRLLIHVQDAYDRGAVRVQTEQVVRQLLAFNVVDFGTRISIGLIYRAVLAVQGVEYAELQWLSTEPPPNEKTLDAGSQQATSLVLADDWNYGTSTSIVLPNDTNVLLNNPTTPTAMAISTVASGPANVAPQIANVAIGDHVVMTQENDQTKWLSLIVTGLPTIYPVFLITEVQTLTPFGTILGGTFSLTLLGVSTAPIQWNATAAQVKAAIDAAISGNRVTVTGGPANTTPLTLTFPEYGDVAPIVVNSSLTGGLIPSTTTTPVTEVQRLTPGGTISGGTWTLTILGVTTAAIQWNATFGAVQTAINTAIPGNTVVVGGGPTNSAFLTLTFNNYGNPAQVTVASSLTGTTPTLTPSTTTAGVPEVQTVTPDATAITGGTFTMTLLGVTTGPIQWNANATAIKAAIDAAISGNTVTVAGGPVNTTPFTLTYTVYGDVAQVVINSSLTGMTLLPATTTTGTDGSNTGWASIPVAKVAQASNVPQTNTMVEISFIHYAPTPDTPTWDVNDIQTDELLIPRIFPPLPDLSETVTTKALANNVATLTLAEVHQFVPGYKVTVASVDATFNGDYIISSVTTTTISYALTAANVASTPTTTGSVTLIDPSAPESITDFPDLKTDAERTHDGLWVKALGGLANT